MFAIVALNAEVYGEHKGLRRLIVDPTCKILSYIELLYIRRDGEMSTHECRTNIFFDILCKRHVVL